MWRKFISNQYVARLGGALAAAGTTYLATGDGKVAILSGVSFLAYGVVHAGAQAAAPATPADGGASK